MVENIRRRIRRWLGVKDLPIEIVRDPQDGNPLFIMADPERVNMDDLVSCVVASDGTCLEGIRIVRYVSK